MGLRNGLKRADTGGHVLSYANQETCRERDREAAGSLEGVEASLRLLVGTAPVAGQVGIEGFEHHALGRRDTPEGQQLVGGECSGVRMRKQPRLVEHQSGHLGQVLNGGGEAMPGEPFRRHRIAGFGALTECEQGLMATYGGPRPGNLENLLRVEVGGLQACGWAGEGAVAAAVPAQHRQGYEDLRAERDAVAVMAVAYSACSLSEVLAAHVRV